MPVLPDAASVERRGPEACRGEEVRCASTTAITPTRHKATRAWRPAEGTAGRFEFDEEEEFEFDEEEEHEMRDGYPARVWAARQRARGWRSG